MNNMKEEILLQTSDTNNNLPEEINHASDSDYNMESKTNYTFKSGGVFGM